jgi:hypothetical protein
VLDPGTDDEPASRILEGLTKKPPGAKPATQAEAPAARTPAAVARKGPDTRMTFGDIIADVADDEEKKKLLKTLAKLSAKHRVDVKELDITVEDIANFMRDAGEGAWDTTEKGVKGFVAWLQAMGEPIERGLGKLVEKVLETRVPGTSR